MFVFTLLLVACGDMSAYNLPDDFDNVTADYDDTGSPLATDLVTAPDGLTESYTLHEPDLEDPDEDTGFDDDLPDDDDEGCEDVYITWSGPDDPIVGDNWTVFLHCDNALLLGGYIVRLDPYDMASIKGNEIEFTSEGIADLSIQSGVWVATTTVTVGE